MSETNDSQAAPEGTLSVLGASSLLPANWAELDAPKRVSALVESHHTAKLVPSLPSDELFRLVKEAGFDASLELLPYASNDQWQAFIDLDGWDSDVVSYKRFKSWFEAAQAAGLETHGRFLAALDPEYLVVLLQGHATIHEKDVDIDLIPDDREIFTSPDGEFWIDLPQGHTETPIIQRTLRLLYANDLVAARRVLRAVRSELPSSSTEELYQFRLGRLADMGYLAPDEAREMLVPIDIEELKAEIDERLDTAESVAPTVAAGDPARLLPSLRLRASPFLAAALERLGLGEDLDAFTMTAAFVANQWLVAFCHDLGEVEEHNEALAFSLGLLGIGLEHLSDGDEAKAELILRRVVVKDIFRTGYTLVSGLANRAREQVRKMGGNLFDAPLSGTIAALTAPEPALAVGWDDELGLLTRPFRTAAEVEEARKAVDQARRLRKLFGRRLGYKRELLDELRESGFDEAKIASIKLSSLWLTSLAHRMLGEPSTLHPIGATQLEAVSEILLSPTRNAAGARTLRADVRNQVEKALELMADADPEQAEALLGLVRTAFDRFETTLGTIADDEVIDARFLGDLFLVRD